MLTCTHEKCKRRLTKLSSRDLLLPVMEIFSNQLSQNSQSSKIIKRKLLRKLMNEFHPSKNNCAKQSITPSQGTHNWLFLSKQDNFHFYVAVGKSSRSPRIFLPEKAKGRGFRIGPNWMSFPSKARMFVLFKKRFLLKKAIDRKLQRKKVSKFTKL